MNKLMSKEIIQHKIRYRECISCMCYFSVRNCTSMYVEEPTEFLRNESKITFVRGYVCAVLFNLTLWAICAYETCCWILVEMQITCKSDIGKELCKRHYESTVCSSSLIAFRGRSRVNIFVRPRDWRVMGLHLASFLSHVSLYHQFRLQPNYKRRIIYWVNSNWPSSLKLIAILLRRFDRKHNLLMRILCL